jgi:hypothetical protein
MRVVLPAVAVALLVAACGPAREPSAGADPTIVNIPPQDVKTKIVGATPEQEEILRNALSGVGDRRIETITAEEAEPGWGEADGGIGLTFEPRAEAADDMRFSWEAFLVGEALDERSRELSHPHVAYVSIPGESSVPGRPGPASHRTKGAVDSFIERLDKAAARARVKVAEVEVLKPLGYAVAITVEVPDPASFFVRRAPDFFEQLGEGPADFDLRFVDSKGEWVSENWHAGSGGSVGIRPDLESCGPYLVSRPVGYKPPPCPAEPEASKELEVETVPPAKVTTAIVGATPKQRAIIEQTLAGLGPTQIDSVHVHQKVDQRWAFAAPESVGIDVKFGMVDSFTSWQAEIVGFVFGRQSIALGLQPVAFVGVNGDRSAGLDLGSDLKTTPMTRSEADKALRRVAEVAAAHGASTRARVFEPSRLAFAIEFRAAKPADFLRNGLRPSLAPLQTEPGRTEGAHVKIVDAHGERVYESGGEGWVREDLISCVPYGRFGRPGEPEPPPCPAK